MAETGRVFISYRREETEYPAGWLYHRLAEHLGKDQVFKDVDSIPLGDDFVDVITAAVAGCDVLLAAIGNRWLTITDDDGQRRLDDPHDYVRLEIEAALARNVRVIPILFSGARMPRADELPPSLAKLARRQALELRAADFNTNRLIDVLERTLTEVKAQREYAERETQESSPPPPEERLLDALSLVDKGFELGEQGQPAEAIDVYDQVVARFGDDTHAPVRKRVVMALIYKATALGELGQSAEEIDVYDQVAARFSDDAHRPIREQVATALVDKGIALGMQGRSAEAIDVYDQVVARFSNDTQPTVRKLVATALVFKGFRLGKQGRSAEAIRVYDQVAARFGDDSHPPVREEVATALVYKGIMLAEEGRSAEAIDVCEEVVARYGDDTHPPVRDQVTNALAIKNEL